MRIKKLDERIELLKNLLLYADGTVTGQFHDLWEPELMTSDKLAHMTELCQGYIRLRSYNVSLAAAWLGMSKRGVVEACRAGRLPYEQLGGPGSEWRLYHEDLVDFVKSRRYEL